MLRGCQKKVIHLKNTESDIFDEAIFLVSDTVRENLRDEDFIKEANRIISENVIQRERKERINIKLGFVFFLLGALAFGLGALIFNWIF